MSGLFVEGGGGIQIESVVKANPTEPLPSSRIFTFFLLFYVYVFVVMAPVLAYIVSLNDGAWGASLYEYSSSSPCRTP